MVILLVSKDGVKPASEFYASKNLQPFKVNESANYYNLLVDLKNMMRGDISAPIFEKQIEFEEDFENQICSTIQQLDAKEAEKVDFNTLT